MDSPETYNRVKHIEASSSKALLKILNSLLFVIFTTSLIAIFLSLTPLIPSLITAVISALLFIVIWRSLAHRKKRCRFCKTPLHHIYRSMILSPEYLAMQGFKLGDFYYAPCSWGKKHSPTGWAKISHRAIACHHCRISREGYQASYEPLSEHELATAKSQNSDSNR